MPDRGREMRRGNVDLCLHDGLPPAAAAKDRGNAVVGRWPHCCLS